MQDKTSFALDARAAKRGAAIAAGIDEAYVGRIVDRFYEAVRSDPMLGPIFAARVTDWPRHLDTMKRFWRSVLHNSGEYSGRPMSKHIAIEGLVDEHFHRWLALFYATLREEQPGEEATRTVGATARRIADSLLTGIALRRDGLGAARAGKDLPYV